MNKQYKSHSMLYWLRRERTDYTQQDIANMLGVSLSYFKKLEQGKRKPTPEIAAKWARLLKISQEELESYWFPSE